MRTEYLLLTWQFCLFLIMVARINLFFEKNEVFDPWVERLLRYV